MIEPVGSVTVAWLELFVSGSVLVGSLHLARWFAWGRFLGTRRG